MPRIVLTVLLAALLASGASSARTLEIVFIDVEGGASTLIVTPAGQSLLIDAGYGGRQGRDPARIRAAATEAGLDRIDYLLVTHFHNDHVGGVPELAASIPIGTFIDYGSPTGSDRMSIGAFNPYAERTLTSSRDRETGCRSKASRPRSSAQAACSCRRRSRAGASTMRCARVPTITPKMEPRTSARSA
jgi:beta-lactamase superfamily II metal-dependent hydrolase